VSLPSVGLALRFDELEFRDKQDYNSAVTIAALQRLIAEHGVPEDDLRDLAPRRESAVKGYLIPQGGIQDSRLMLQDVEIGAQVRRDASRCRLR
jgi:hypothetical protein